MGNFKEFMERIHRWRIESRDLHEEFHKLHCEYGRQQKELLMRQKALEGQFRKTCRHKGDCQSEEFLELQKEFQRQKDELKKRFEDLRKGKIELHKLHRHAKFSPPIILILSLLIWYLVFKYEGIKVIGIFFAVLFSAGGFFEFFFLRKIERRILTPIHKLKIGLEEISKGNYDVKVESRIPNEIGLLIDSFNQMAQKLKESEKIKTEYEENRRTLIANISHDLKTPITSIQGYIEAITEGNMIATENANKYLKIIYNNTAYINKLIDDLFLFSKLDMQKLDFNFESVKVKPFVNDLMEEFKLEFEENDIKFDYSDNLSVEYTFNIDRKRLHQVFRNIIGNAIKYGSEQNLAISTDVYENNGFINFDIRDNGPGIPEDKLPYIFERFYRIDTERTKDFTSTGLGLAIAKELVEAHGGSISVTSKRNEGSCFTVMIPVIQ